MKNEELRVKNYKFINEILRCVQNASHPERSEGFFIKKIGFVLGTNPFINS
ncbi:hypothetical protein [Sedimentibacter sp. B4]|uniref:hypothetical protein n=1 Tax=Sedimentibacter sp. B4 TaxID=304766 RepID=UPI0002F3F70A|nr:hypothetical protein [Sedimentibacter sp. B4]